MLGIVKNLYRGFILFFLWIILIAFPIIGAVIGYSLSRHGGGIFVGFILGLIVGFIVDVLVGGLSATVLEIDEKLEFLMRNSNKTGSSSSGGSSGGNLSGTDLSKIASINANYGDTWTCKKCNEKNPIASSSCKGCGAYK